jgi:hypothetical protein
MPLRCHPPTRVARCARGDSGQAGFGAFINGDKNLETQQSLLGLPFAILPLSTNHWPSIRPNGFFEAFSISLGPPGPEDTVQHEIAGDLFAAQNHRQQLSSKHFGRNHDIWLH